jgi:hypothetical protein
MTPEERVNGQQNGRATHDVCGGLPNSREDVAAPKGRLWLVELTDSLKVAPINTIGRQMTHTVRLFPSWIVVVCVLVFVAGCSSTSSASTAATTASNASAAAQTASFDLKLLTRGRVTKPVSDTALADALTALEGADGSLTQTQATGDVLQLVKRSLALVRKAEDTVANSQQSVRSGVPGSAVDNLILTLHKISVSLADLNRKLQAKS